GRSAPPPAGAIWLVPAGSPARWRWSGRRDLLAIYLESGLVAQVAAEAFDLDPARLTVPSLDCVDLPHLRAEIGAVGAELTAGGTGGRGAARALGQRPAGPPIRPRPAPPGGARRRGGTAARGGRRAR